MLCALVKQTSDKSLLQFLRYMLVGGFNTVFGYGLFAFFNWSLSRLGSYAYMYASVLGSLTSISVAFLLYKWFVFRTRGNYLVEWIRCLGVYGSSVIITLAGMPILVTILRHRLHNPVQAPYIAGALMTVIIMLFSFFGHKNISFRQKIAGLNQNPSSASKDDPL